MYPIHKFVRSCTAVTATTITLIPSLTIRPSLPPLPLCHLQSKLNTNIILYMRPILNLQLLDSKPLPHQSLPHKTLHRMKPILVLFRHKPQLLIISRPMTMFLDLQQPPASVTYYNILPRERITSSSVCGMNAKLDLSLHRRIPTFARGRMTCVKTTSAKRAS